jgi:hypothetical protein
MKTCFGSWLSSHPQVEKSELYDNCMVVKEQKKNVYPPLSVLMEEFGSSNN